MKHDDITNQALDLAKSAGLSAEEIYTAASQPPENAPPSEESKKPLLK